mgnify:CR=1 FL=1
MEYLTLNKVKLKRSDTLEATPSLIVSCFEFLCYEFSFNLSPPAVNDKVQNLGVHFKSQINL